MIDDYRSYCNHLIVNDEVFYKKVGDKIELYSYGCPDSIWDLETISHCIDQDKLDDTIIFIDTCCAIDIQEDISKRVVDRITSVYPDKKIYITGCDIEYDRAYYDGLGVLFDNKEKFDYHNSYKGILKDALDPINAPHMSGFVKISDGCNYNCSYCVIKNVRHHRMFSYEEVSQQVRNHIAGGVYEVCLFGTEICSYNSDGLNLTRLIERLLNDFPELTRIKLDTIHPGFNDIDNLISLIQREDRLSKDLDLGIQSCSDTMLKLMRRSYNVKRIKHILEIGEGLDINFQLIVGFSGETEELFRESLNTLIEMSPDRITLCPFSERKNTEAELLPNKVPHNISEHREFTIVNTLKDVSNQQIEKEGISELNKFKPVDDSGYHIFHVDLYDKDSFIEIFRKLKVMKDAGDSIIYCDFNQNKNIRDLSINIKLLIITFGVKVITKIKITDETIKFNYPRLLTTDLLSFVEFEFTELKYTTVDELTTFISDVRECNIDCDNLISRISAAGNKKLMRMVANRL